MRRVLMIAVVAFGSAIVGGNAATAQDGKIQFASHSSVQEMMDRIESLEATLASYESDGDFVVIDDEGVISGGGKGSCKGCGAAGCNCVCGDGCALYAGVEVVFAKPYFEDGVDRSSSGPSDESYNFEGSPRVILGGRNACGTGARVRWWNWDHRSSNDPGQGFQENPFRLNVDAVDLDATQMVCWGPVNAMFFGGVRYGRVEHSNRFGNGTRFEGTGPTLGVDVNIPVHCKVALIGNYRYAALFGESTITQSNQVNHDKFASNHEVQLGVQYSHCCGHGTLNIKGLVEAQAWVDVTESPDNGLNNNNDPDDDLGFVGFGFALEYVY